MSWVNGTVSAIAGQNINKTVSNHGVGRVKALLFDMRHGALGKDDSKSIAVGEAEHLDKSMRWHGNEITSQRE
jgi:hypothetical protein